VAPFQLHAFPSCTALPPKPLTRRWIRRLNGKQTYYLSSGERAAIMAQDKNNNTRDAGAGRDEEDLGAGPDDGKVRTGPESSKSLKYSQEVTSTEDEPEREGRSLATTHHEVIRQWAEERDGVPATVEGTGHGDHLGVLHIDFGGENDKLRHISWEEWFETFDSRGLNFIYQEQRSDGQQSNFFRLENPGREDA